MCYILYLVLQSAGQSGHIIFLDFIHSEFYAILHFILRGFYLFVIFCPFGILYVWDFFCFWILPNLGFWLFRKFCPSEILSILGFCPVCGFCSFRILFICDYVHSGFGFSDFHIGFVLANNVVLLKY